MIVVDIFPFSHNSAAPVKVKSLFSFYLYPHSAYLVAVQWNSYANVVCEMVRNLLDAIRQACINHSFGVCTECVFLFIRCTMVAQCHERDNRNFLKDVLKPCVNIFPQKRKGKKTASEWGIQRFRRRVAILIGPDGRRSGANSGSEIYLSLPLMSHSALGSLA